MSNRRLITVALPVLFVSACAFAQLDLPWDDDDDLWDNDHDSRSVEEILASGPEIRDPFFEICLGLVQGDSLGVWTGDELAARIAATGRESKLPIDLVDRIEREALPFAQWQHRHSSQARRIVRMVMRDDIDLPLPYSILGYHPGTLYVSRMVEFLEWNLGSPNMSYYNKVAMNLTSENLTALELREGWVVLDVDGWLDRLLGKKLDDTWMEAFVLGRVWGSGDPLEDGMQGLALGRSRKGRPLTGSFDFRNDKVLPNGRSLAGALAAAARPVAAPYEERVEGRAWSWPRGR